MNVTVEHLGPCKKLLRVEIEAEAAQAELESVTRKFQQQAKFAGFRPGKAPRHLVEKTFSDRIDTEVRQNLINNAYRKAIEQEKLRPIAVPEVEESPWEPGKPLCFTATLETEAVFEVPDYKGLPIRRDNRVVTDEDVERALRRLQEEKPEFTDLARPVQTGDFVIVNYVGTCDGKPITETAPTARGLTEQQSFWLEIRPEGFLPGFAEQLVGANAGETRSVAVTFPADFVTKELAGKQGTFQVTVVQVKEKRLPPLDDVLAKSYGVETLEKLRAGVRNNLERELNSTQQRQVRDQLVATLLGRVNVELPESLVEQETRNVVFDIVKANQERGIPKTAIDERKDEIYSVANNSARERVKAMIVLNRIAELEKITATREEITDRVVRLAAYHQIKPEKLLKQLQEQGGLRQIQQQIIESKVLDALELYAQVEDVPQV